MSYQPSATPVLGFWCYRITDEHALLPA
jgi:hypothetical protein